MCASGSDINGESGRGRSLPVVVLSIFSALAFACVLAFIVMPAQRAGADHGSHDESAGGFQVSTVFENLTEPTGVEFASDGRVFVAEKSGSSKSSTA